ncbi:MAG: hypothetical protein KDE27_13415, partial [Planctomycetes bacterium]|nr:hypothetical protein [Planctomycetota bacterium]
LPPEQRERPATVALIVELLFTQATWASALGAPDERVAELLERAYSGAEDLLRRGQLTADQRLLAATVLARRGTMLGGADAGAARTLLERSRALLEPFLADPATNVARLPQVLSVLSSGAKFLLEAGDIDIALGLAERLHAIVADEHERDDDLLRRARLLPASEAIASIFYRAEKFSRAIDELRPAIATRRELVRDFPAVPAHRQGLGRDLLNSALSAVWSAQFDDAAAWTDEAVELFGALIEQHPTSQENRRYLLQAYTCVAHNATARAAYRAAVDWRDAEAAIARGRALSADPALLADRSEAALDYRAEFAYVTGRVESKRGRPEAAATAFATALDCYGELRERQPATISYAARLVDVREGLARALLELGRHEEAAPLVEAAIATQRELDPQLASRRKLADKQRRLHELRVRVDIARGEFDGVLPGIDALLALSPAVAYDWEGHDRAARLAFEAARLAPADSEWRERFAARCRAEVESTIPGAATYESTSEAMLAVMSSNSVRTLVALEQELGNHAAAAAAQARVAAGYDAAFEARGSERNRE